jgi:hypothetical protein
MLTVGGFLTSHRRRYIYMGPELAQEGQTVLPRLACMALTICIILSLNLHTLLIYYSILPLQLPLNTWSIFWPHTPRLSLILSPSRRKDLDVRDALKKVEELKHLLCKVTTWLRRCDASYHVPAHKVKLSCRGPNKDNLHSSISATHWFICILKLWASHL